MTKFGIYNVDDESIVCDPIEDKERLCSILERHGVSAESIEFDQAERLHHLLVLPSIDEKPEPPKPLGYAGRLTRWAYDAEREALVRTVEWSKVDFDTFERELYEHLALEESRALKQVKAGYTDEAVETWDQQRSEADKWTVDNTASVPLLESQAATRGISIAELVEKVLAKANDAAQITGLVLGSVQGAGDQIEAIKAEPELPADWFEQMQDIADTWQTNWPQELLGG